MDINKILTELRSEREDIQRAIIAFERIDAKKRRGRLPQWMKALEKPTKKPVKKTPSKDKGS